MQHMTSKTQCTVIGATYLNFKTDDGKQFNRIKLHILQPMDDSQGSKFGLSETNKMFLEPGDMYLRLFQHKDYPMEGELHWHDVSDGKGGSLRKATDFIPNDAKPAK